MELWIRSQDKTGLIKVSNVQYTYRKGDLYSDIRGKHYIGTYYDNLEILGEYATKERALEILEEIQERIKHINKFSLVNEDYECDDCVYQMPEK